MCVDLANCDGNCSQCQHERMTLEVPPEVALSPSGKTLRFDTFRRRFYDEDGHVGALALAKVERLATATRWVKENWPESNGESGHATD